MIISGYVNHEDSASYTSYRCFKIICYWIIYRYHINIITLIFLHHARLLHPPIELSVILYSMHTVYFVPIVCMSLSFVRRLVWIIQKIYLLYNHWQRASLLTCSYSCSKCENIDKLCTLLSCRSYVYPAMEWKASCTYDDLAHVLQFTQATFCMCPAIYSSSVWCGLASLTDSPLTIAS